ncbi:MAG: hypothetical protein Q8P12_07345 [bacterium]|nr:hypothetical protein [bacterium]
MNSAEEIILPEVAKVYALERLSNGNRFSRELLPLIDKKKGHIRSFLPRSSLPKAIENPRFGGITVSEQSRSWLVGEIAKFLEGGKNRLVVMENAVARPGDPVLDTTLSCWAAYEDEIFHLLRSQEYKLSDIHEIIEEAESPHILIGALVRLNSDPLESEEPRRLTLQDLKRLAQGTMAIIVAAFDGEGYLLWSFENVSVP